MTHETRVNLGTQHPTSYKALIALSSAAEQNAAAAGLDALLVELVKLRTSQINGCAFCLRLHTRDALTRGETPDRLAVLSAWRETAYFSDRERAALALVESLTLIADTHAADGDEATAREVLSADEHAAIAWLTIVMNAFNRVAITSRYDVAPVS
ncbi:carboxymuconolactone decarboxylase family protein [Microbacterium sp.]|uniref:carboxymuconolactone decarboxylase family protein n=1 Tax=Microbacterium sp. TaxID=51671 RepID=UPI0039E46DF3